MGSTSSSKINPLLVIGGLSVAGFFVYSFTKNNSKGGSAVSLGPFIDAMDVLNSNTADQEGITEQYNPPDVVWFNAMALADNVITPALTWLANQSDDVPVLSIHSWYRSPALNEAVGGADGSDHLSGSAADLELILNGEKRNDLLARAFLASGVQWDQLILEEDIPINPAWIHISFDRSVANQNNQILRYNGSEYITKTRQWAEDTFL